VNGSGVVVLVWMSELVEMGVTLGGRLVFVALERLPSVAVVAGSPNGVEVATGTRVGGLSKAAGRAWDQGSCRDGVIKAPR